MLGFPVTGLEGEISFTDRIFTHFEQQEPNERFTGKLKEDLVRIRNALDSATSSSIMILNETFSSTSVADARYLASKMMHTMLKRGIRRAAGQEHHRLQAGNSTGLSARSSSSGQNP
jgi:DNA mismatch repair ATPase MutS